MVRKIPILFTTLIFTFCFQVSHAQEIKENLTAHRAGEKFEQLDLENLPVWDKDVYKSRFKEIRDKKFLIYDNEERRIPWFYTRDGCHVRATHFIKEAQRLGYVAPKRVFIFGSIEMKGTIIPHGSVEPWFHSAPIVKVDGKALVLDPSVNFTEPLPLDQWVSLIAKDRSKTIYSICEPDTYLPTTSCDNPEPIDMEKLGEETQLFLKFEGNILNYLGLSIK